MSDKKVFIGVAWPYVNGTLHIGHLAGYLLPADMCSRYNRAVGNDTLMVSGSDCFGTPVTVEADKKGVSPNEIVEKYHNEDVEIFLNQLKLSYDLYSRTDHPNHISFVQELFVKMMEKDLIFVDTTKQYYSPTEDKFLPDRYVVGECAYCGFKDARSDQCDNCGKLLTHKELKDPRSSISGESVELKDTQHYFVDWEKLQPFIEDYVNNNSSNWKSWVASEVKGWLKEGLKARAITRDINWGIPLPKGRIPKDKLVENIDSKRIYVWFEAVIGYLSGSILWAKENNKSWEDFWYESEDKELKHYYFMGKDNLAFHCLFWPAQIFSYDEDLHLPDVNSINMFLNYEGKQFSKSRGISVDIKDIVNKYGNDTVRFYLTLIMPELRDASFSWNDFEEKVNGILVANLGNFIHRVLSIAKNVDKDKFDGYKISEEVLSVIERAFNGSLENLEVCEFRKYLDEILSLSRYGNNLVDDRKLWDLKNDSKEFFQALYDLLAIIISLGYLMYPLMFEATDRLFDMLGLENGDDWTFTKGNIREHLKDCLDKISLSTEPEPLFDKIDLD